MSTIGYSEIEFFSTSWRFSGLIDVIEGATVVSCGFELLGEPSSSVTLNGIKEVLQNTFVNLRKLNITDLTDILVTDGKNKINSTVHHNSFRNRRHFTSDECQSYVFSDKDENDEFLRRLFLRKIGGLTHNRLKGTSLYSNFMINSLQINLHKIRKLEDLTDSNQKTQRRCNLV